MIWENLERLSVSIRFTDNWSTENKTQTFETIQQDVSYLQKEAFCFEVQISKVLDTSSLLSQCKSTIHDLLQNLLFFLIGPNWN